MQTLPSGLPPLQTLRAFTAVARLKSFTMAADDLAVTQTAVSHQIAQLEDWIGGRLFVRDRRGVELTPLGQGLLPDVVGALENLEQALGRARRSLGSPKLRISTSPEFATQWLTPRLTGFCDAHPEVDVSVTVQYRRALVVNDDIDVAIWLSGGMLERGAERLTADEEFAVCAPELARELPRREGMRTAPLLRYEGARYTVLDWRRWHGQIYGDSDKHDFDGGPSYRTFPEMLDACRSGAGFALVRSSLVTDDLAAGRLVRCFTESVVSDLQYQLVIMPSRREEAQIRAFRHWILEQAKPAA
ncbi:LysR substrate-binding domain-containing protein [Mesorhizobium sp. ZC-5]|uniref:LysR substrate-binding domain-containing protein n=1 Tax=Mesorhizobium sp. ZC-5 TaxID=2986066 RepID=UPI0021E95C1E|nr:LysR substrate-binding domain-containing protein [Mesorhizobium sp. ZC-5]MCV3239863.1 LysR substrate-binding domain-containing protein [Mesorhizobium sp. ZC-5]